jgi:serine/threonine protein kinase
VPRNIGDVGASVLTGRRIGTYQLQTLIGAGGMGEVYRARDTKLGRDVAVKILPRLFTTDPGRLARFEREARLLASLNHPHIGAIYGLEEADGVPALILELVEGETLAERLQRGALPVAEALTIATQIADALDAAHERGIVHRDLKPANIKLTPAGAVKILDFGLAKAVTADTSGSDVSQSPTVTVGGTREGVILGTVAYMSPEQARGRPVDKRADVWAFGVVLYEMLCGRRPFEGDTLSDTMAAVLRSEPDWARLPPDTPVLLHTLLRRMLQKEPRHRLRDVADGFISELGAPRADSTSVGPRRNRITIGFAVAGFAVVLTAVLGWRYTTRDIDLNWSGEVVGGPPIAVGPRMSPDGAMLAFQAWVDGQNQVAVMKPESGNWTVLTNDRSRGQIMDLSWSPDGTRIYFDRYLDVPRGVFSVPVLGGDARPVADDAMYPKALPDGSLLIIRLNAERRLQLHHFWPDKGQTDPLPAFWTPGGGLPLVAVFPDGKQAVFYGLPAGAEARETQSLHIVDLTTRQTRALDSTLRISQGAFPGGLAVSRDGNRVLVDTSAGSLHRIVSIARGGSGGLRALLTLSTATAYLDTGPDGALYADQLDRAGQILRFPASGGNPERIGVIPTAMIGEGFPVSLRDGRVLMSSRLLGRNRLMVVGKGRDAYPLLEGQAESTTPAAVLSDDQIAFLADAAPNQTIAVASLTTGRILRRLEGTRGGSIQSLAASSDRKTIFYASRGTVWAVDTTDGRPRKVHQGDAVAVDPRTDGLIVQLFDSRGARLVRVDPTGGPDRPVTFKSDMFLALFPLSGNAVDRDGRILVQVTGRDFWFFQPGLVDPATGRLERIPLSYEGDVLSPGWSQSGDIVSAGFPLTSSIWRFRASAR